MSMVHTPLKGRVILCQNPLYLAAFTILSQNILLLISNEVQVCSSANSHPPLQGEGQGEVKGACEKSLEYHR